MEKQEYTVGWESGLPWQVQQTLCSPTLSGLTPCFGTYQNIGPSELNSCSQPSQLSYAVNASISVHAAFPQCQQQLKFCGENLPAQATAEAENSAMVNVVKQEIPIRKEKHSNFGEWNGGMAEGLNQVEFKLESSESCHKRFIIVDQSGSKARIIFHPALMHEFPNLLPNSRNVSDSINNGETEAIQKILSAYTATEWGNKLMTYRESMVSPQTGKTGLDEVTFGDGFFGFSTQCELSCNESSSLAKSEGHHSEFSEDTRDIEALLSSDEGFYDEDDEEVVSTGHTPSKVIINNELSSTQDSADVPRKRRRCGDGECNEQEVDFIPNMLEKKRVHSSLKCSSATVFENEIVYEHIKPSSNSVDKKPSSKSSSTKEHPGNSSLGTGSSSKRLRIEKLKRTLDALRSVVPAGGECRDAALVLDVATRYLRSLQLQVKKLEANQSHKDGMTL